MCRPIGLARRSQRIKELEWEVKELRRANNILKAAGAFFAPAQHLCAQARHMIQAVVEQSAVDSVADLPEEGWEACTKMPEYELFVLGAYACGFVCSDLIPDVDLNAVTLRLRETLREMTLPHLRHYIHTLMRSERAGYGYGSLIYDAVRAGVFEVLCERLEYGSDLYESL